MFLDSIYSSRLIALELQAEFLFDSRGEDLVLFWNFFRISKSCLKNGYHVLQNVFLSKTK